MHFRDQAVLEMSLSSMLALRDLRVPVGGTATSLAGLGI